MDAMLGKSPRIDPPVTFDPYLADIRFGCGLSPSIAAPRDVTSLLSGLLEPDQMEANFPIEPFDIFPAKINKWNILTKNLRRHRGTEKGEHARKERALLARTSRMDANQWLAKTLCRRI